MIEEAARDKGKKVSEGAELYRALVVKLRSEMLLS